MTVVWGERKGWIMGGPDVDVRDMEGVELLVVEMDVMVLVLVEFAGSGETVTVLDWGCAVLVGFAPPLTVLVTVTVSFSGVAVTVTVMKPAAA